MLLSVRVVCTSGCHSALVISSLTPPLSSFLEVAVGGKVGSPHCISLLCMVSMEFWGMR